MVIELPGVPTYKPYSLPNTSTDNILLPLIVIALLLMLPPITLPPLIVIPSPL